MLLFIRVTMAVSVWEPLILINAGVQLAMGAPTVNRVSLTGSDKSLILVVRQGSVTCHP